jgi:pimeloyl-ACP methyl ester carboxylesterase/DNA-binding winged helix-turn-helix (wHTH) protein
VNLFISRLLYHAGAEAPTSDDLQHGTTTDVIFRFDDFELDTAKRELRRAGRPRALQPLVFAALAYLIEHRDRVVSKAELLEQLWPDVVVTDASVQRAISLARDAIDDNGARLRTVPKQGYRFSASVRTERPTPEGKSFQPRFVRSGDVHIAYHTIGEGPVDLVVVSPWVAPMRVLAAQPGVATWLARLSELGRVVMFDKRGTGNSDRVKKLPTLEQRVDDLRAVLDAIGSTDAILIGVSEGGTLCLVCAAALPDRVRGVVLLSAFARWAAAPDYPFGWGPQAVQKLRDYIRAAWGGGHSIRPAFGAAFGDDSEFAEWTARMELEGASPGAALDLLEMNLQLDIRPVLPTVSVPVIVLHNAHDTVSDVGNGRYLAAHIPGAELIEPDTRDHLFLTSGADFSIAAIKKLIERPRQTSTHFLSTVLAVEWDAEDSDTSPFESTIARFKGMSTGAPNVWSFDGPQRAIQCAHGLQVQNPAARMQIGVHAGEVARAGGRLHGEGVDTARAIAQAGMPGEIWVSQILRDLVHGSALTFSPRQSVELPDGRSITTLASERPAEITKR